MQVVLPVLCSYMSHWWEHGPESNPDTADSCCTSVTSEHMNTLLGNILKIIYNNLGIDEGAWMKRLAGEYDPPLCVCGWVHEHGGVCLHQTCVICSAYLITLIYLV